MSNLKNNPIPTLNPQRQLIPGEFDLLALTPKEGDTNNVLSFIDYTTTDKQAEGLLPIEIEIRDAETFAKMVAQEPDKYYRLLQNYHLKLIQAKMRAA
jgi:hypothetical protein